MPFGGRRLLGWIEHGRIVYDVRIAFGAAFGGGHVRREHGHVLVVGLVQVEPLPDVVQPSIAAVAEDVVHVLHVLVRVLLEELDYGVGALLLERAHHVRGQALIVVHLARPPAVAQLHPHDVAVAKHPALLTHLATGTQWGWLWMDLQGNAESNEYITLQHPPPT